MTVSSDLDRRFRDAAASQGLLDVAYDLVDTPVGRLLVAVTDHGLCEISYDPDLEREEEQLARNFGARVLRSPKPTDEVRANSTSTSPASGGTSTWPSTFALRATSAGRCSTSSPGSRTAS